MPIKEAKYIWFDGRLVPWEEAKIHVMTHSLHYGTAVFEGIRAYYNKGELYVFRLRDHLRRMERSAKIYGFPFKYDVETLEQAVIELLRANQIKEDAYIRPITFLGYGTIGLVFTEVPSHTAIIAFPFGRYFEKEGVHVVVSSWRRITGESTPPIAKVSGHYVNSVLAKMEALKNGYDEAIMLDSRGYVSEGSGENVFIVRDGVIVTPPVSSDILEGITRDTIIKLAKEEGFKVEVREIPRAELYVSDEIFLVGTAAEVTPVLSVDGRPVGDGKIGPVTSKIRSVYRSIVCGEDDRHPEWRTPVYG